MTLLITEAKFEAMNVVATETKSAVSLLSEIGLSSLLLHSIQHEDNTGAIFMAENTAIDQQTKHIADVWYQFVSNMIIAKELSTTHIPSDSNPSKVMAKNLPHVLFSAHKSMIRNGHLGRMYAPQNLEGVSHPVKEQLSLLALPGNHSAYCTVIDINLSMQAKEPGCFIGPTSRKTDPCDSSQVLVKP
jgi:hypothetical protein